MLLKSLKTGIPFLAKSGMRRKVSLIPYPVPQNSTFRPVFEAVYVLNFQRIFVVWIDMDFMLRNHLCAYFFTFFFGNNARGNNVSDFNMDDFSAARTLDVQITTFFALAQFMCAYRAASKSFHNSSVCSC